MAIRKLRGSDPTTVTPSKPKVLIYGPPGAGKTWASLEFPSVYYIDTEGGADLAHYTERLKASGARYLGPNDGSCDFPTVIDEIQTLATTEHDRKTLVIDSFSKLFNTQVSITAEAMEKAGVVDVFGASKKQAVVYTRRMITWFNKLDMNVVLICHQKSVWRDNKEVGFTFDGWDKLEYELHLALRIAKQGDSRKAFVGKTRLLSFPDGDNFDWSYREFSKRYGKEVMEAPAKPAQMATAEQVAEFKHLSGRIKCEASVREKLDAEAPDDMEAEKIAKWLAWLRGQDAAQNTKAPAA